MDVEQNAGDVLLAHFAPGGVVDLVTKQHLAPDYEMSFQIVSGVTEKPYLLWKTDHSGSGKGFVLSYIPAYEQIPILGDAGQMVESAAGFRLVPVFHEYSLRENAADFALEAQNVGSKWLETEDWVGIFGESSKWGEEICWKLRIG